MKLHTLTITLIATCACGVPASQSSSQSPSQRAHSSSLSDVTAPDRVGVGTWDPVIVAASGEGEGEGSAGVGEGEGEGSANVGEGEGEGGGVVAPPSPPLFIAVGYGGRRLSSVDGVNWQNDVSDAPNGGDDNNLLRDVCVGKDANGNRVFLAVGGSAIGRMMRTTDGSSWDSHVDNNGWLGGCAYGNGMFVAAGSSRSIRSLDGGDSWTDPTFHYVWQIRDMAFGDGLFVAVGDQGVFTTPDGINWTQQASTSLQSVTFGPAGFAAVGNGQRAFSSDGVTWTFASSGAKAVASSSSEYVAVGTYLSLTSTDAQHWDQHTQNVPPLDIVAAGNGVYVSSTWPNTRRISTDGIAWTQTANDADNAINALVYSD